MISGDIMLPFSGYGNAAQRSEAKMIAKVEHDADDQPIRFAIGSCSLGSVLVATSPQGICAVLIGETDASVRDDLDQRFDGATLVPAETAAATPLRQVIEAIEDPAQTHDLLLDVRGTAFQRRVWDMLRTIPAGQTRSYLDVAKAICAPAAARAVAAACAANPVAVLVPCHRVVRGDGSLSGYRWGVERKRALLARERQSAMAA
jgi:AraC family transcriptional regulator, regulatory protein of adaptative response / methylated-DNA-[protein]-cysteine methyltransferase